MTSAPTATHADVAEFIRTDPAFQRALGDLAKQLGIDRFLPYNSVLLGADQRRLMLTGDGLDGIRRLLRDEYDLVVHFARTCIRELAAADIPDQEYPPGEEPDADVDETVEVTGYPPQALFYPLCDLLVLRQQDPAALRAYLKALGLPGIRAWQSTLTRAYRDATGQLS
jgi:hypothetical protein